MFVYALVIWTLIKHWNQFHGSYYKLFLFSSILVCFTYFSFNITELECLLLCEQLAHDAINQQCLQRLYLFGLFQAKDIYWN